MKKSIFFIRPAITIFILATLSLTSFSQGSTLNAVADTIDLYPGIPLTYDILANDSIAADDTIKIISLNGGGHVGCQIIHGATWVFTFNASWNTDTEIFGSYTLHTMSDNSSSATILFRIHDKSYSFLDINNVRARFNATGNHFWYDSAAYEVPKGSGKTSIFLNTFWIGGKDSQGQLHLAAERYGQGTGNRAFTKHDFYAGPVMDSTNYSQTQDTAWHYVWNLKKSDIDYHRAHYWEAGYTPIHDILTWPGNGNTALGQAQKLAPFSDRNGNGIYEPYDGDYPEIRGDQALFFIFNDDRDTHTETTGTKLGVEIHGMAYGFNMAQDSALKNTVFLNYKILNRSGNTYDSTLMGIFTDLDLGYANDDYVGCDVERNMYFAYNGDSIDGTGQSYAYGANPPAQGVILLGGPLMDADGIDNPRYDNYGHQLCDYSVNGLNFGDGIADNERLGLQGFMYFNNAQAGVPWYMTDPLYAPEYYQVMARKWKDDSHLIYGGNGNPGTGGYGPDCNFMFPGESDTLNWGVGCAPPNGPKNWTEETANNMPQDRRGLGITGPVTFKPGDVIDLDIAFAWARDYNNPGRLASLDKLRQMADIVSKSFATNTLPNGNFFYGIGDPEKAALMTVKIYPNPATDQLNIVFGQEKALNHATIELINSQGNCIRSLLGVTNPGNTATMNISGVPAGFYFIRVMSEDAVAVKKVVIQ